MYLYESIDLHTSMADLLVRQADLLLLLLPASPPQPTHRQQRGRSNAGQNRPGCRTSSAVSVSIILPNQSDG